MLILDVQNGWPGIVRIVSQGTVIDKEEEQIPGSGVIRHETCWKCGKKNPLPEGICAKCAGHATKKVGSSLIFYVLPR
jgi:hypothetical protein